MYHLFIHPRFVHETVPHSTYIFHMVFECAVHVANISFLLYNIHSIPSFDAVKTKVNRKLFEHRFSSSLRLLAISILCCFQWNHCMCRGKKCSVDFIGMNCTRELSKWKWLWRRHTEGCSEWNTQNCMKSLWMEQSSHIQAISRWHIRRTHIVWPLFWPCDTIASLLKLSRGNLSISMSQKKILEAKLFFLYYFILLIKNREIYKK